MRLTLVTLLLVSILLIFGCLGSSPAQTPADNTSVITPPANNTVVAAPPAAPCSSVNTIADNDACFVSLAVHDSNISWCSHIFSTDARDDCLSPFVSSNALLCDQMINSGKQQACYDAVAHQLNSSSYCSRLTDNATRKQCLIDIAQPCDLETDNDAKGRCLAAQHSDFNYCGSDGRLFDYALSHSEPLACGRISADRARVLACQAAVKKDPTACTADNLSSRADYCYELAAAALNDSVWCSYAQLGSPYSNDCYTHFAITGADQSVCQKTTPETARDQCYLNYSVALDNVSVCDKIINTLNRNRCIVYTAKTNGDPSACNPLAHSDRISCYNNVLTGTVPIRDVASCSSIVETQVWQSRCFTAFAVQHHDITVCDLITEDGYKAACQAKLS